MVSQKDLTVKRRKKEYGAKMDELPAKRPSPGSSSLIRNLRRPLQQQLYGSHQSPSSLPRARR
jgi:hypothetical protein